MATKRRWFLGLMMLVVGVLGLGGRVAAATVPEVLGDDNFQWRTSCKCTVSVSCTAAGGGQHMRNVTASSTGRYNAVLLPADATTVPQWQWLQHRAMARAPARQQARWAPAARHNALRSTSRSQRRFPEFVPLTVVLALFAVAGIITFARRKEFARSPLKR